DPQIGDLRQIRQDLIQHTVSEVGVLFIVAQIFKRQDRNRFYRSVDCCVLCRSSRVATEEKQSNRYNRASNYYIDPSALFVRSRWDRMNVLGAFKPLRCKFEGPRQTKRNRQTEYNEQHKGLNDPIRNGENRQHLREALCQGPSGDDVRNSNLINVAPL